MRKITLGLLAATMAGLGFSASAMGASITFTAVVPIPVGPGSAAATLFSPGTIVSATDFGAGTQVTSEGVTFTDQVAATAIQKAGVTGTNTAGFNGTDDATLNAALGGFAYDGNPTIVQLQGLTVGQQYQVQLFAIDDRPEGQGGGLRTVKFSDGTNSSPTFVEDTNVYVLGTFTADAATQNIQSIGLGRPADLNDTGSNVNAVIVRAVPEPASISLFGLSAVSVLIRRRRA